MVSLEVVEQRAVGKGVEGDHVMVAAPLGPQQTYQHMVSHSVVQLGPEEIREILPE